MIRLVLTVLLLAGPAVAQDEPILTCGLEDCSQLGDPLYGATPEERARIETAMARLNAMSQSDLTELVALSIGQVGCFAGWPSDELDIYDYYAAAGLKMARNLGLRPEEAARIGYQLEEAFFMGLDDLAAQGRMVSVTAYDDELIPRACAGG